MDLCPWRTTNFHVNPTTCMDIHGSPVSPWITNYLHGSRCIAMGLYGRFLISIHLHRPSCIMDLNRSPLISIDCRWCPWVVLHWDPSIWMDIRGLPWIMDLHRPPFIYMDQHECPQIDLNESPVELSWTCNDRGSSWISMDRVLAPFMSMDVNGVHTETPWKLHRVVHGGSTWSRKISVNHYASS